MCDDSRTADGRPGHWLLGPRAPEVFVRGLSRGFQSPGQRQQLQGRVLAESEQHPLTFRRGRGGGEVWAWGLGCLKPAVGGQVILGYLPVLIFITVLGLII